MAVITLCARYAGLGRRAAGLATRPVDQTVADVLAWDAARGGPASERDPFPPAEEARLLAAHDEVTR